VRGGGSEDTWNGVLLAAGGIVASSTFSVLTRRDLGRAVVPVAMLHEAAFGVEAAAGEGVGVLDVGQAVGINAPVGIQHRAATIGVIPVALHHSLRAVRETVDSEQRVRVVIDYLIRVAEITVGVQVALLHCNGVYVASRLCDTAGPR